MSKEIARGLAYKVLDVCYKLVTGDNHPLSYVLNINTFFWGFFMMFYGISSRSTFFSQWLMMSTSIIPMIWGGVVMLASVLLFIFMLKNMLRLVKILSLIMISLWLVPIVAFSISGLIPFLIFSVLNCISHSYLALAAALNTLDRI